MGGFVVFQLLKFEIIWIVEVVILLIIVGFAFLVQQQSVYEKQRAFYTALKKINENEIKSIKSQENIYADGAEFVNDEHSYTSDLDIFGRASLFNLVNRCSSPVGIDLLADWFKKADEEENIRQRQEAIKELGTKPGWVQHVKALLWPTKGTSRTDIDNLLGYFITEGNSFSPYLKTYISLVPYLFLVSAVGAWFFPWFTLILGLIVLSNACLVVSNQLKVNSTDRMLSRVGKTLSAYAEGFDKIEAETWTSSLCVSLKQQMGSSFASELKQLSILVGRLEYRLNMFVGPLLNGIAAWDVRQLIAIEDWKRANRDLMPRAFHSLATFEALISLSSLYTNYPGWCFPEIEKQEGYTFTAQDLAHPLIPDSHRVSNSFSLENTRHIDIVTGSNMAGKSTFLRTVGINAVLAFSGAPVCARTMKITVMHLFAYMRIRDSLNESISTFKAELNRLKLLLDVLQQERKVYFLIDEMLRGTNSVDKYRGSKALIEKLVHQEAVGIVATHDLQLAELEEKYPRYIRNFYFDIQVIEGEMRFDYKLKEGECKTFNASLLLKQIGIDVDV